MEKLKFLLGSRKFWAAMVTLVMMVVKAYNPNFPLSEEQLTTMIYLVMAYILGTAIEDTARNIRG